MPFPGCKKRTYLLLTGNLCKFASTNPQYDDRLFIELRVQYMNIASSEHGENMLCTHFFLVFFLTFRSTYVHNMIYPCGLGDARISASEKDLPVIQRLPILRET